MFCPECGYKINENDSFCFACGSMLKKSVGDGRYEIIKILGKGGMGQVLLAHDSKMETDIVLKQLIPPKDDDAMKFEYLEKRMKEEAKLLYRLNYNGLPKVMDCFSENGNFFLVMQYIEGKDLSKVLSEQPEGKIELSQCIPWMDRLLDILGFLHGHEPPIIHRDIKPQNIMIDKSDILYLVDFGIAMQMGKRQEYTRIGTCDYASPENFTGKYDKTSDIYSLGATFYRLITGLAPADRIHPESFPPIREYLPDCPEKLQEIFDKMTAFNKADRFNDCMEIRQELRSDKTLAGFLANEVFPLSAPVIDEKISADDVEKETVPPVSETVPEAQPAEQVKEKEETDKQVGKPETGDIESKSEDVESKQEKKEENISGGEGFLSDKILNLIVIFLAIAFFSTIAVMMYLQVPLPFVKQQEKQYTVTAVTGKMDNISHLRKLAGAKKLKYKIIRKINYKIKDRKYRVLACFVSRPTAMVAYKYWVEKGFRVSIGERPDLGIFLDAEDDFFTHREEAEKRAEATNKELEGQYVSVMEIPEKIPVISFHFIVPGLESKRASTIIKKEFSKFAEKVEITDANEQEGQSDEVY